MGLLLKIVITFVLSMILICAFGSGLTCENVIIALVVGTISQTFFHLALRN